MIGRSRQRVIAFLRQGAWFSTLPETLQDRFLDLADIRTFAKEHIIQTEEGDGVGMTVILEGSVRFLRHVLEREPRLLHIGEPGFWFGQMTLVQDGRPVVTAVSRTTTKALVLTRPAFRRLVAEDPRLEQAVNQFVFERMRLSHRYLAQAQDLPAYERLRVCLADLADLRRLDVGVEGPSVTLNIAQSELSEIVRLSRQQVNARLRALQALGLVELVQRHIRILDTDRLRTTSVGESVLAADRRQRRGKSKED